MSLPVWQLECIRQVFADASRRDYPPVARASEYHQTHAKCCKVGMNKPIESGCMVQSNRVPMVQITTKSFQVLFICVCSLSLSLSLPLCLQQWIESNRLHSVIVFSVSDREWGGVGGVGGVASTAAVYISNHAKPNQFEEHTHDINYLSLSLSLSL